MSSSKQFKDYILDQLNELNSISFRPMMGEFLLYYNNVLFGGIYDNRLLIKKTNSNSSFKLKSVTPYNNAKPMYLVENTIDKKYLRELILATVLDLK